ncbi:MAG TPA: 2-oxo acid dehydrogenase subunit E2 [Solirubrobacteraceae bacterium]|nr:2-oxo acid dehydrogenase subunit E2 [Solirubrobacteraceae bacterium]
MAAVKEVTVPDIGDFSDVPVIEVLVEVGQEIAAEDPLVALESDKATMEVPAPFGGVVEEIKVSVGDKVSQGDLLLTLAEEGDGDDQEEDGGDEEARPEADADAEEEPAVDAEGEEAERDDGSGDDEEAPAPQGSDAPPEEAPEREDEPAPAPAPAARGGEAGDREPVYASPAVRRLARELEVDLRSVKGTGRKGRITVEDVRAAAEGGGERPEPAKAEQAAAPAASTGGREERVPLSRIKRISGPRLQQAWQTIPHVTQFDEADITDLEAFRKRINAEQDVKVTMVALMVKACIASLKAFPDVNASLDGDDLILKRDYHIGFAADTPQGLLVPVIKDADQKGLLAIAAELRELSEKARSGKISAAEMQGGTFTISSLGGIGGTAFTPIINPPQVAILGVSRSVMKPVWNGSEFEPRLMVPLSLSYDHRVIDGAAAARFTAHLASVLNDLRRVLL